MNNQDVNNLLFDTFGLPPEYRVLWTDVEWVEFYEPPNLIGFARYESKLADSYTYPNKKRLHLNKHTVVTENGIEISANFAVHHQARTIWFRVMSIKGVR